VGVGAGVAGPSSRTDPPADTSPATTTADPRRGSGRPVVLAFGGDVHFEGVLRTKLLHDPASVLAPVAPILSRADLAMVNLETALTDRGTPEAKKYQFRAPASALDALASAGVDLATMANNHGRDFGAVGLQDTLAIIAAGKVPIAGIGSDAAHAYAPSRFTFNGQRIAVIAATDVLDNNLERAWTATDTQPGLASAKQQDRLLTAVRGARVDTDTLVVFLHWGVEEQACPSARQRQLARALVDAGADVIVGSHAHRQQGAGRLGDAFVDYGLGNFAFYNERGTAGVSGVLVVTVTGRQVDGYSGVPARIRGGSPTPRAGAPADQDVRAWSALRSCTGLTP
jgi:poly-gamma-glutamate synthesis protein (capsule biosynthesis protein)